MNSPTLGFSLSAEDQERVQRLASRYAHGNRSAWLRQAIDLFEERALFDTLAHLQAQGDRRTAARHLDRETLQDLLAATARQPSTHHAERVSAMLDAAGVSLALPADRNEVDAFLKSTDHVQETQRVDR